MSDTPETDALTLESIREGEQSEYLLRLNRMIPHANNLERQRNIYREALMCVIQCDPSTDQANIAKGFLAKADALK